MPDRYVEEFLPPAAQVPGGDGHAFDPHRERELGDPPQRAPRQGVIGRPGPGQASRGAAVGSVTAGLVAHAVAEQPAEDLFSGTGGDGIGEFAEPVADELGPDVAGLHLESARSGILLDLALPVGDPVARLAERGRAAAVVQLETHLAANHYSQAIPSNAKPRNI